MPITGTLLADFTAFETAVKKAEVSLKGMETGAGKVETQLNRMTDGFSGRKLIQDATLITEAIERIGGASTLTDKQARSVNASVTEAIEKFRKLGQEAPADMLKLAAATRQVQTPMEQLKSAASSTLGALGIAFTGAAIIGGIKNLIGGTLEYASQVKFLGDKLDISYEATQRFITAGKQSGTTMEVVGAAIAKMNLELGQGSSGTIKALQDAGLQFNQIRSMKAEDAFRAITTAIEGIPDPMLQARIAMELFGKSGQDLLPAIREGFNAAADGARVMSEETIRRLEAAKQKWENFGNSVTIVTGEALVEIGDAWTTGLSNVTNTLKDFFSGTEFGFHRNRERIVNEAQATVDEVSAQFARLIRGTGAPGGLIAPGLGPVDPARLQAQLDAINKGKEADLKAAEAKNKHADAIRNLIAAMTGADLAQKERDRTEALKKMTAAEYEQYIQFKVTHELMPKINTDMNVLNAQIAALGGNVKLTAAPLSELQRNLAAIASGLVPVGKLFQEQQKALASIGDILGPVGQKYLQLKQAEEELAAAKLNGALDLTKQAFEAMGPKGHIIAMVIDQIQAFANVAKMASATSVSAANATAAAWAAAGGFIAQAIAFLVNQEMNDRALELASNIRNILRELQNGTADLSNGLEGVINELIANGQTAEEAMQELNEQVSLFLDEAENRGGLWSEAFQEFIDGARQSGIEVDALNSAIASQVANLIASSVKLGKALAATIKNDYASITKDALKSYEDQLKAAQGHDDLIKVIEDARAGYIAGVNEDLLEKYRGDLARVANITLMSFNALVAGGMSASEAMDELGPGFDDLVAAAKQLGFEGNEAFETLSRWREITVANKPLLDQISTLNGILVATANLGGLTASGFEDIEAQGVSAYNQLRAAGLTQNQALAAIAPLLNTIKRLHEQNGLAIDDATQALIDQAGTAGLLAPDQDKIAKDQLQVQKDIKDILEKLVTVLEGPLDRALKNMGHTAVDEFGRATGAAAEFHRTVTGLGSLGIGHGVTGAGPEVFPQAAGGDYVVNRPTLFMAGEAGPERATFSPLVRGGFSGSSGSAGVMTLRVIHETEDGKVLADKLIRLIPGAVEQYVARMR